MTQVSEVIAERMGLHFLEDRWPELLRSLQNANRDLGLKEPDGCLHLLASRAITDHQIAMLANHLTIGETYFFRDPASFELLEREILPLLITQRVGNTQMLRLWSAGCCTGEEPYSLAISCMRTVPDIDRWNVSILATDINPTFLEKAAKGVYSEWSFRNAPDWLRERFFSRLPERKFAIHPTVQRFVRFDYLNLATDLYPSLHTHTNAMDIIFCRNVLMYFTPKQQKMVITAFHQCLVDGGLIVVSPAEASADLFSMFTMEHHNSSGVLLFRKTDVPLHRNPWSLVVAPPTPQTADATATTVPPRVEVAAPPISFESASQLFHEGHYTAAAAQLMRLVKNEPNGARIPLLLARIYANQGKLDEALRWCDRAIAAERTNPATYFLSATIHHEAGHLQEAITALGKVLYLDQDFILAHHALGTLYTKVGKPRESKRHLTIALALLSARNQEDIVPESDGMNGSQLIESIRVLMGAA